MSVVVGKKKNAQLLGVLVTFLNDTSSIPSSYMVAQNYL